MFNNICAVITRTCTHTHMLPHQQQQHHLLFLTCIPGSFSDSPARAMEEDDDDSASPIIKKGLVRR
jgi:hypothetical protein